VAIDLLFTVSTSESSHWTRRPSIITLLGRPVAFMVMFSRRYCVRNFNGFFFLAVLSLNMAVAGAQDETTQETAQEKDVFEDFIVAVINKEPITLRYLLQRARLQRKFSKLEKERSPQAQQMLAEKLKSLIIEKLIMQRGKELKVSLDKTDQKEVLRRIKEKAEPFNGLTGLKNALAERGVSDRALEDEIKSNIIIGRVYYIAISKNLFVSPRQIREFYTENPKDFVRPAKTKIRRIRLSLDPEDLTDDGTEWLKQEKTVWSPEACRKLGEYIRLRILNRGDVGQLAGKYTMRYSEQRKNGLLEFSSLDEKFAKVEGVKGLAEISDKLQEGEVSELIETRSKGLDLVYLELRRPLSAEGFQSAQEDIVRTIKRVEFDLKIQVWLATLRSKATIRQFAPSQK
jgi:hypothetical protein